MIANTKLTQLIFTWLCSLGYPDATLSSLAGDAGFRQYFRVQARGFSQGQAIVMVAQQADTQGEQFFDLAVLLKSYGLHVPNILERNLDYGFALIEDLGSVHYLDMLSSTQAQNESDALYHDAVQAIAVMQDIPAITLPPYDAVLLRQEMELFTTWLCEKELAIYLSKKTYDALESVFSLLEQSALEQPTRLVHRDYHSRNLLCCSENASNQEYAYANPGILDFQDAVCGPITYDLVSLLKDCYVAWPYARVKAWVDRFHALYWSQWDRATFYRWFNRMGVQRHLKASGIFARLHLRDGKAGYLKDIPRTLRYIVDVPDESVEMLWLQKWVDEIVLPKWKIIHPELST